MDKILISLIAEMNEIKGNYKTTKDLSVLCSELLNFGNKYKEYMSVGDYLLTHGEEYFSCGDTSAAMTFVKAAEELAACVVNKTLLFLRLAEYYIENGERDRGCEYLIKLCTETVDNYEDAIEANELTELWLKYKPFVSDKVPASVSPDSQAEIGGPEGCSKNIADIFELSADEILSELSTHVSEMSSGGEEISDLNKYEKTFFYADELWMEVNSGGFSGYLYYYGHHFERAYAALEAVGACKVTSIMERARSKFPKAKIPKTIDAIMNAIDKMEEKGVDFEAEDTEFYEVGDKELSEVLLEFVLANKERFR